MDQKTFENSHNTADYIQSLKNYRKLVQRLHREVPPQTDRGRELLSLIDTHVAPVRATVMTEDWCDDSACNIPVIDRLFGNAGIPLGIIRMSENPALKSRYNSLGVDRIPVLSIWDGNWNELARWVEHPAGAESAIQQWKSRHPEFQATKNSSAPDDRRTFRRLFKEYLDHMAWEYKDRLWVETTREIIESLRSVRR